MGHKPKNFMPKAITITANDDQTFTVELEPTQAAPEAPEMGAENAMPDMMEDKAEGETGQTVQSIDEALDLARQMLQDDGRSPQESAQAGYDKGKRQMPGKMGPGAVFGE